VRVMSEGMGQRRLGSHPSGLRRGGLQQGTNGLCRFCLSLAIGLLACSAWAQSTQARVRALLIGVSEYEHPALKAHSLPGPRNDVTLMWRRLQDLKVAPEDITVLSEGIPEGPKFPRVTALPTVASIKGELKQLAAISSAGDTLIFFFAGHGTVEESVPHNGRPSTQALDQVLLPRDAGEYDTQARMERNGLLHTELGELLDEIRAKGTFVWAIVDACHAGYSTREITDARVRGIEPEVLKIPLPSMRGGAALDDVSPLKGLTDRKLPGTIVGFFAVDSRTPTVEIPFPAEYEQPLSGSGETRNIGYFTYHLHRGLGEQKAQSYGQLSDVILAAMKRAEPSPARGLPIFDGDLEHPFLDGRHPALTRAAQLRGSEVHLSAGSLHGFTIGSGINLYREPTGEAQIGTAIIERSEPLISTAKLDVERGAGSPAVEEAWAELTRPAIQLTFRVGRPPPTQTNPSIDTLLERAATLAPRAGIKVELAAFNDASLDAWAATDKGEIVLFSKRSRAAEGLALQPIARHSLGASPEELSKRLGDDLWNLARAAHLARIPGFATGALNRGALSIDARIIPSRGNTTTGQDTCAPSSDAVVTLKPRSTQRVIEGNIVCVFASNLHGHNIKVAVFYVEVSGKVLLLGKNPSSDCWTPVSQPGSAGAQTVAAMKIVTSEQVPDKKIRQLPLGLEYVVVVAFEFSEGSSPEICHLQQPGIAAAEQRTRGGSGEAAALMELLQPSYGNRSAGARAPGNQGQTSSLVRTYELDVVTN
jgi:hypothetical protein